jgi:outer membrane protein OmpA-like peptidoglycan-associated protein
MLMPAGLTIPWIMGFTERKRLIIAYPECKNEKQGPAVRRCVKKIDIEEGRIKPKSGVKTSSRESEQNNLTPPPALEPEPAPSPPPKLARSAPPPPPPSPPKVIDKMTVQGLFYSGRSILTEADVKELRKAVAFVKKYHGANIRLDGYTDSIGTDAYNISLSERRAVAVKDYLIKEAGLSSSKITVVGHGKADPVADNKTAEGRAKNRRVEISILSD